MHSSTLLDAKLYVDAGISENSSINSIEFLNIKTLQKTTANSTWEMIIIDAMLPRYSPVVFPVNKSHIAVLGGRDIDIISDAVYINVVNL